MSLKVFLDGVINAANGLKQKTEDRSTVATNVPYKPLRTNCRKKRLPAFSVGRSLKEESTKSTSAAPKSALGLRKRLDQVTRKSREAQN